jgi:hypothetical protein
MPPDITTASKEEMKHAVKEAIREWLDEKFLEFGKWSFRGLVAALIAAVLYLSLVTHGWNPPK